MSQWFGGYKKANGFGPEHVFHSFRHTLETQLRALLVPKYRIGAITGHAGEDVSDEYAHPPPAGLRPALARLQFPGLSLPRIFAVPTCQPANGGAGAHKPARHPNSRAQGFGLLART